MIDETLVAREQDAIMQTYARLPVAIRRGRGVELEAVDGTTYLDWVAGISMMNVGHCHPAVVEAIRTQAGELVNTSNLVYTEQQVQLAEWLSSHSLGGKVFFCNSGAEANEAAIKLCRRHNSDRSEFVTLVDSFHGRTMGALSLTGQPGKQAPFRPLISGVRHVQRNDLDALEAAVSDRTSAIFLELIQGECGVYPLDPEFVGLARALADRHGALLVFDEIQTGMARTGPLFAYQDVGVAPDIMCLAKSLGAGIPLGAVVATPALSTAFQRGDHGSTFAGGALACAVGLAVCGIVGERAFQDRVRLVGARLQAGLERLVRAGLASETRGRGLMHAIDLPRDNAADAVAALIDQGMIVNNTSANTLRFLPPLVVGEPEVDRLLDALQLVLTR